jgi:purine-binding chemotaxis protein CheW
MSTQSPEAQNTYLSFSIGDEQFAVNVDRVLEVLQKQTITNVPNSPDFFKGVINFRGEIIPVVDTSIKLNLPVETLDEHYVVIVIELEIDGEKIVAGAMANKVNDVISITPQDIMPVPRMSKELRTEFFSGIVRRDERFILIVNFDKLILSDETLQLKEFVKASSEAIEEEGIAK